MNKLTLMLGAGVILLASCSKSASEYSLEGVMNMQLSDAQTLSDSVAAIDGTFISSYYMYNLQGSPTPHAWDKEQLEAGIKYVLEQDTTNLSYLQGIQIGMQLLDAWRESSANVEVPKERLLHAIHAVMSLDSIDSEQLMQVRQQFFAINDKAAEQHKYQMEAQYINTREGKENIMLADCVAAEWKEKPGITTDRRAPNVLKQSISKAGRGGAIFDDMKVTYSYEITRLNGEPFDAGSQITSYAGQAKNPILRTVLPLTEFGEEATYYVPYDYAYGAAGDPKVGAQPCESFLVHLKVAN